MLFFGARTQEELPYFGPLQNLPRDFIDSNFAFSRTPGQPKRYVQDVMHERAPDLVALLQDRDGLATRLKAELSIVDKRRSGPGKSEVANIIGDVSGRRCILFDDMIDGGGTLTNAAQALVDNGALEVSAYVTHGVLSGAAVERVNSSILKELVMTDSISPPDRATEGGKIRYVSCDRLIGEAIRRIANEESVSKLFD